jgi:ABC-type transport system involved in cytochrome bd biosynthesis fused ATPase/permease subunit
MAMPHAYATRPATLDQPMTEELLTRLAIAQVLVHNPTVLLLDEPTESLDRSARNRLLPTLAHLTLGRITVLATRDPLVAAIADHRLWLEPTTGNVVDRDTSRTERTRLPGMPLPPRRR